MLKYIYEPKLADATGGTSPPQTVGYYDSLEDTIDAVKGKKDMGQRERGRIWKKEL